MNRILFVENILFVIVFAYKLTFVVLLLVKYSYITVFGGCLDLVEADNSLVEPGDLVAIIDLLGCIQVNSTVVNSKLVLSEEGDSNLPKVEIINFAKNLSTVQLLLLLFDDLAQLRYPVNFAVFTFEFGSERFVSLHLIQFFLVAYFL